MNYKGGCHLCLYVQALHGPLKFSLIFGAIYPLARAQWAVACNVSGNLPYHGIIYPLTKKKELYTLFYIEKSYAQKLYLTTYIVSDQKKYT